MARQLVMVELEGVLFSKRMKKAWYDAIADGLDEMTERGTDILIGYIHQAGFIDTGGFISSIETEHPREKGAGYGSIKIKDQWPTPGRPTRIWFERGTRRGKTLRKGGRGVAKTETRLRQMSFDSIFLGRIEKALNG